MKTYTATQAAIELNIDVSRVLVLCREKRLGYTLPKHNRQWVITYTEIDTYRALGPRRAGRPRKPRKLRLLRVAEDGNHVWG